MNLGVVKPKFLINISIYIFFIGSVFLLFKPDAAAQSPSHGISDKIIAIGQSCDLQGSSKKLGMGMRDGAFAYFSYVNENNGINNRRISLQTLDDKGQPSICVENTNTLIDNEKVFLLFGYVGTSTSKAAIPICTQKQIPFFAPYSGAEFLRQPVKQNVFNLRAGFDAEAEELVNRLFVDKDIKRISVFYQNDSYGLAGLSGVKKALAKRNREILNEAGYPADTEDVENAVKTFLAIKPGAIIMIGTSKPCAKFIRMMRMAGSKSIFLNVSHVDGIALGELLANDGLGVVISQVVPFPYYRKIPIVSEYNRLSRKYTPEAELNFIGMEGFIAAKALCKIIKDIPDPITTEKFIKTAEKQDDVDLGGFPFSFSPNDHQGSDLVYLTQIGPGGFLTPIQNLTDLYEFKK